MQLPSLTKKQLFFIIGAFLFVILFMVLWANQPQPPIQPNPNPTPTLPQDTTTPQLLSPLTVEQVFPQPGTTELGGTTNSITIFFDQPINPTSGEITTAPTHPIILTTRPQDPNMLIIQPQVDWGINQTYTITLQPGLMSTDNQYTLKRPIELNYTMIEPKLPNLTAPI